MLCFPNSFAKKRAASTRGAFLFFSQRFQQRMRPIRGALFFPRGAHGGELRARAVGAESEERGHVGRNGIGKFGVPGVGFVRRFRVRYEGAQRREMQNVAVVHFAELVLHSTTYNTAHRIEPLPKVEMDERKT